jgi:hypothetical protein
MHQCAETFLHDIDRRCGGDVTAAKVDLIFIGGRVRTPEHPAGFAPALAVRGALRHVLFPLLGLAVVGYGVWESVNPGQQILDLRLGLPRGPAVGACYALRPGGASAEVLSNGVTEE